MPSDFIARTSPAAVQVDEGFIANLIAKPDLLGSCDDGVISPAGAYFEIQGTASGEFLHEIGLRNGDMVVSVNGQPLQSYSDAAVAYPDLYVAGETSYRLLVERSGAPTTLSIELVP